MQLLYGPIIIQKLHEFSHLYLANHISNASLDDIKNDLNLHILRVSPERDKISRN